MNKRLGHFLFLNVGHLYDHLFMLLYPTVVLSLEKDPIFAGSYGGLITLSVYGFIAFGAGALPAGWLGDRWSRRGMMIVFFIGIGLASIFTGMAETPLGLGIGLTSIGLFAAIYHPVGIAMVASNARYLGKELGINGVFGNLGVASAALTAGFIADAYGWRVAFIAPGVVSIVTGLAYALYVRGMDLEPAKSKDSARPKHIEKAEVIRVFAVILGATAFGTMIFNGATIGLPKIFDQRLGELATTATDVGMWAFGVFATAAVAQVIIGHLLDRYPLKPIFITVALLQVPVLLLAATAVGLPMLATALAMMLLAFSAIPINDTLVARHTTDAWRARVYAAKYVVGLGIASATVPMLGMIHDATGDFYWMFVILAGCAAMVVVCALILPGARQPVRAAA